MKYKVTFCFIRPVTSYRVRNSEANTPTHTHTHTNTYLYAISF